MKTEKLEYPGEKELKAVSCAGEVDWGKIIENNYRLGFFMGFLSATVVISLIYFLSK